MSVTGGPGKHIKGVQHLEEADYMRGLPKVGRRRFGLALLVVVAGLVTAGLLGGAANAGACQAGATKSWDEGAGTFNWHDGNNWNPNGVPGVTDHVCIDLATSTVQLSTSATILSLDAQDALNILGGTLNLTSTTVDSEATNLALDGTLGGAGQLIIEPGGSMTWTQGSMTGGGTLRVLSTSTLVISGPNAKTLNNRVLNNEGVTTWTGTGDINQGNGAVMFNSGTFDIQNDEPMIFNQGGFRLQINNSGTLTKSAGVGTTDIQASMDNDGTVVATSGILQLAGGTTWNDDVADSSTGDFSVTVGDTLTFGGGPSHRLAGAGSSVTGAGTIVFPSGTSEVGVQDYDITGETVINGGTANFNTLAVNTPTTEDLTLSSGVLGGTGLLTVGDQGTWSGGTMTGAGTTTISGAATLSIEGATAKTINGARTLDNQGTTTWTGTGDIQHGTSALMTSSGTFDIQTDADMTHNQGGTRLHITNTGTFQKTAGLGSSLLGAALDNDGLVQVSEANITLTGGTNEGDVNDFSTGDWFAEAGADTINFGGSSAHRLGGTGSSITGDGLIIFSGNDVTMNVDLYDITGVTRFSSGTAFFNTATATTEGLHMEGGSLSGTGTLVVPAGGSAFWSAGTMTGAGTTRISATDGIDPAATLSIHLDTAKTINGGRTLDNQGNTTWTGTGIIQHGTGALMTNSGTFDIQTDADTVHNQGGTRLHITNTGTGTFEKTTGAAQTLIDAALENDGLVDVSAGTLQLNGGTDETTPADVSGGDFSSTGAILEFGGGVHRISGAGSSVTSTAFSQVAFSGGGPSTINPATFDVDGATSVNGGDFDFNTPAATTEDLTVSGGTLGGTGTLTVEGSGIWSGGIMADAGTTRIDPLASFNIQGTTAKTINSGRTLDNQGNTTWTGTGNIQHGTGALMTNSGTFDIQTDADTTHNQGGTRLHITNTGAGTFEKTSGTDITIVDGALENDGTVDSSSGTLRLTGGTDETTPGDVSGGDWIGDVGATVDFGGGTHRLGGAGSSVTGTGIVGFSGGTTDVGVSDYEMTGAGTTLINGGTANFDTLPATSPTTTNLTMSSGILGGTGELAVPGTGSWTGGIMTNTGTSIFQGTLSIDGNASKTINSGHTLDNQGVATWTGDGAIQHGGSAILVNSGTFSIQTDADMVHNQGGTRLLVNNTGELGKTAGAGTSDLHVTVDNTPAGGGEGTVRASSGTLFLNGSGSLVNYNSTTDTLTDGIYIVAGATFKFTDADIDVNAADIILDGATSAIVDASDVDALGDFATNQDSFAIINGRDLTSTVPVSNSGIMTISNGTFTATGDYTQTDGETHLVDAPSELVATGGCVDIQGGVLKGVGTAEPCVDVSGGNVQPGGSAGILNTDGTYGQSAGTLDIEVGGTTPGTGHDQLAATGAATLGGTLALDTVGSFTPADGDSFVVMTFASRTGTFATETWSDLPGTLDFTVDYNPTNVTVTVGEAGGTLSADLLVIKNDAGREPKPLGRGFRYGIRVINLGPDGATEVMLVDTLPDEVAFVSYRAGQGTCTEDTGVVTCDLGSLASGAFVRVSIQVRAVASGTATNSVTVSAAESDPVLANNTDSEDTLIGP